MIEIDQALAQVLARATTLPDAQSCSVAQAAGRVLAEHVVSDVDSPPHDKSLVDGYAVRAADVRPARPLRVVEEVPAGAVPSEPVTTGTATRIMTGAPIPAGADAVVMVEHTRPVGAGSDTVDVVRFPVIVGQHIMLQAASIARGQRVLESGTVLRPIEIGLLSEVGRSHVAVVSEPSVAILATGDELVSAGQIPAAGQIRNSNGPMLAALVRRGGARPVDLGVARDDQEQLQELVQRGLAEDVLLLSGGVSAGVRDLVPHVLAAAGVQQVFHKVRLKPGKPLWFGVETGTNDHGDTLVFGLPGNPVSTLVCFEMFVRPALAKLAGMSHPLAPRESATLACQFSHRGDRPTLYPAEVVPGTVPPAVQTLPWKGSADLLTLARADCLIFFPAGEREFEPGDAVEIWRI